MEEEFEENPNIEREKELETKEEKKPENIVEYFEQDLKKQKEELEQLEAMRAAIEDFMEIKNPTQEETAKFLQHQMDEFEKQIGFKKSMIKNEEKKLAEKKAELENKK